MYPPPRSTTSCRLVRELPHLLVAWLPAGCRKAFAAALGAAGVLFVAGPSFAQTTGTVTTLRSFNGPSGEYPNHALTLGADGNFYGVTPDGGANGEGEVFRVTPGGTVTVLHSFDNLVDGYNPECKLLLANDGNFYGTTSSGGPQEQGGSGEYGDGTVFQITPGGTLTILHTFYDDAAASGTQPLAGLVQGSDGLLYGTTSAGGGGGGNGDGTVYQISLEGIFASVHSFDFHTTGSGGYAPKSDLVQGHDGYYYGVASGGDNGVGTIYKVAADGTFVSLYSFNVTDGSGPHGDLAKDSTGTTFYGVTQAGGAGGSSGEGTIYKVTSSGALTTLHSFTSGDAAGGVPLGLLLAQDGNLYGVCVSGRYDEGEILQCTPAGVVTDIYDFNYGVGLYDPVGGLTQGGDGSFFGTTEYGGASSYGTVYRVLVTPHPPFFNGETDLSNGVEYLSFSTGNYFGYFSFLSDLHYIYHFDLGYEYVFNAGDASSGVYLYDFKSSDFFYTSPAFPFPYLYDFNLQTTLYYYPDPAHAGHYNTNGVRYFYDFGTGKIISK